MNRSLRVQHQRMTLVLALFVPVGLVAALTRRADYPVVDGIDWASNGMEPGTSEVTAMHSSIQVFDIEVNLAFLGKSEGHGASVVLSSRDSLQRPSVLAYWSKIAAGPDEVLPADIQLLGTFSGAQTQRLELPASAQEGEGYVLLYSLGHAKVLGALPLSKR